MQIFDSHCHYNLDPLWPEWQSYWRRAQEAGVAESVVIGTSAETSARAVAIATDPVTDQRLWAAIGIHPNEWDARSFTNEEIDTTINQIRTLFVEAPAEVQARIVAIGEIGLDYYHAKSDPTLTSDTLQHIKARQQYALRVQLRLARELKRMPILHVRDRDDEAYAAVLRIVKEELAGTPFLLHCLSGSVAYVDEAMTLGAYCGVAGNVTYKNAHLIRELVHHVPPGRLMLETDAPFLPPQSHRGSICEPAYIRETAAFVEHELQRDLAEIFQTTKDCITSIQ